MVAQFPCLEPGQEQHAHTHAGQDREAQHAAPIPFVIEGMGSFTVGDEVREAGAGWTIEAPAEVPHGVMNSGERRLVPLVGIAPAPRGERDDRRRTARPHGAGRGLRRVHRHRRGALALMLAGCARPPTYAEAQAGGCGPDALPTPPPVTAAPTAAGAAGTLLPTPLPCA